MKIPNTITAVITPETINTIAVELRPFGGIIVDAEENKIYTHTQIRQKKYCMIMMLYLWIA
jgi:hypothetical protein